MLTRALTLFASVLLVLPLSAAPLRVLVSSDVDAVRAHYAAALKSGGATVAEGSPTAEGLAAADAVLLHRRAFAALPADQQQALSAFAARGGGVVALHAAVAAGDEAWGKSVLGGAWDPRHSRSFRSEMMVYLRTDAHPVTHDASSFDIQDDTLYDLALADGIDVLGSAFTPKVTDSKRAQEEAKRHPDRASIYDIQPQMWMFTGATHRAAVFLPGATDATLTHASVRAMVLRSISWTARRDNVDELCAKADLADLRYPAGGPRRAADAIKQFDLLPGFRASVVAAEPLVTKPIAVQWDGRGRLWVAETPEYPNGRRPLSAEPWKEGGVLEPGRYDRPARDRISILEDTNGDGEMDRKTVFHEGLELVTGFCLHRDGVIAVAHPHITWLRDTNGDDKADKEEPIFGGFTPGDTHFVANHFIPAPDGWIYASTGSGATATKPGTSDAVGKVSSGVFRFKADGSAIQQVASQGGNTFGAEVTSDLELFHGKATSGNPLQHVVLPEWVLAKAAGTTARSMNSINPGRPVARTDLPDRPPLMQIDQVGRYSAACSSLVYEGGAWPKEYENTIFVTEPLLDIIHHERLAPSGPTFAGELLLKDREWMRARDYWFCPVDVTFGPDGAMYVLDFYTPVVAHNDTRGPRHSKSGASIRPDREHYFGRIYRIQHEASVPLPQPDLTKADAAGLVEAFRHPNRVVRFNAHRMLMEKADVLGPAAVPLLRAMASDEPFAPARILALWALHRLGKLEPATLASALAATDAGIRRNAWLLIEAGAVSPEDAVVASALGDADPRVRLAALRALSSSRVGPATGARLLAMQNELQDPWSKAAASAAASADAAGQLAALLERGETSPAVEEFARSLAAALATKGDGEGALRVAELAATGKATGLSGLVLRELGQRPPPVPANAAAATAAMRALLIHADRTLGASALALASAWDGSGSLKAEKDGLVKELLATPADARAPADRRSDAIRMLVAARAASPDIMTRLTGLLGTDLPEAVHRDLVAALASTGEEAAATALLNAFTSLSGAKRDLVFDALSSRPDWTVRLLDALEAKKIRPDALGPAQTSRLTNYPDGAIAKRAKRLLALLGAAPNPAKDEIIARLLPQMEKGGDALKGREMFKAACATCHRVGGDGVEFGPPLDGIGAHSTAELLTHIIDPNRVMDDEHRTWNIATRDGTQHAGIIASENDAVVKLRLPGGAVQDLRVADIVKRTRGENSLMPEGLEALGPEMLRDILAYLRTAAPKTAPPAPAGNRDETVPPLKPGNCRALSLAGAFTADTRKGLYASEKATADTLPFVRFGSVLGNGIPFTVVDPATASDGRNVIVLKGGSPGNFAHGLPALVEIPVGLAAKRLHVLGGVAGWGGKGGSPGPEVLKVTLRFAGGRTQEFRLRAGVEFVDYISRIEVPGSAYAPGLVSDHQVRTFALPVEHAEVIERIELEKIGDSKSAPTIVAITAELGAPDPGTPASPVPPSPTVPAAPATKPTPPAGSPAAAVLRADDPKTTAPMGQRFAEPRAAGTLRVLLVGAGSSHDFPRYFLGLDAETLRQAGGIDTAATPNLEEALALLPQADVLVLSGNHGQFGQPAFQTALNAFADAGKGVVILHAGTWRNWAPETGYNARFVGGGAKSHGKGDFPVTVKQPDHALLKGVPAIFTITDENYHATLDPDAPVDVLAVNAPERGVAHPSLWIKRDPKARIVCLTLGHAEPAHRNPAYQRILINAVKWAVARD